MGGYLNKLFTRNNVLLKSILLVLVLSVYLYKVYQVTTKAEATSNAYDSPSYFNFEFFPAFRMQLITIPYTLIKDPDKIIVFQSIVSVVSWIILVIAVVHFFNFSLVSFAAVPFLLILASSSVVLEHNYILASESLNNSSIVLLIATTLYFFKTKSNTSLFFIAIAFILVAGTKSASAMAILVVGLGFFLSVLFISRKVDFKAMSIMGISSLFILFFAATALSSDITKTLTTSGTINNRIWIDENWRDQILKSGYPASARETWEAYSRENLGSPPDQAVVDSAEFVRWWENGGENFLNVFMLRNPNYTLVGPFCLPCINNEFKFDKTLVAGWGVGTNDIRNYLTLRDIGLSRTLFWPVKPEDSYLVMGTVALLVAIALLLSLLSRNYLAGALNSSYTILLSFVISYSLISWWFGSKPADMTRHQLGGALTLRILAIISIVYILTVLAHIIKSRIIKEEINEK